MKLPIPAKLPKEDIYELGEELSADLDLSPGGSIFELVDRLGGVVQYRNEIGKEIPESIEIRRYGDFSIFLSSFSSVKRDRFTVAHELGHYFLHYPLVEEKHPGDGMRATRWVDEDNPDLQRAEWEANWFASGLLMPSESFKKAYKKFGANKMSEVFGVSQNAAKIRIQSLDLQ